MSQSLSQTTQPSQNLQIKDAFQQALSLQNEIKTDEAISAYEKILDKGLTEASNLSREQASVISQNIALLYFQKKDTQLTYVYNQKSLALDPNNKQASEFQKQNKNLFQTTSIPRDISMTENLNSMGLKYVPTEILFGAVFFLAIYVFKNILQFFVDRKKSDIMNLSIVHFKARNYVFIFLLLATSLLLGLKITDDSVLKVIVRSPSVTVYASAGENQATVTQAEIGTILNVLKMSNDADLAYVQIKYPGAYSGWVKRSDLELLNSAKWPVFIDKK
jgi:tetratricopeptide (TPR) repeat protein